jgi:4-hydroxybenzoate polyprenyltransferase
MTTTVRPRPAFWREYLVTMRPHLCFVSGFVGLAGLALAPVAPPLPTALVAMAYFLSYGFGQALIDCFQMDTDAVSSPYRPLVRGTVRRREVMAVSLAGMALCGVAVTAWQPATLPLVVLTVLGVASYTPVKRRWWGGPFYTAWIVALMAVIAWLAGAGAAGAPPAWSPAHTAVVGTVFFGYANFILAGHGKDAEADRATGYRTFPVVFGRRAASGVSDGLAAAAWLATLAAVWLRWPDLSAGSRVAVGLLLLAGLLVSLAAQGRLRGMRADRKVHRAAIPVVHAQLLLLAAAAAAFRPDWIALLLALYVAFVAAANLRPAVTRL